MFIYFRVIVALMVVFILLAGCNQESTEPEPVINTWMRTYGGNQNDFCGALLEASDGDGGYYIVGGTNVQYEPEMQGDVYLIRVNAAWEVLWDRTYGGEQYEQGNAIIWTNNNEWVIAGQTASFGAEGMDVYLIKVDQDGNEIWSRTFGGPLDEWISAILQADDGGYVLIGNIVDPNDIIADAGAAGYGGFTGRSNILMIRTDSQGNELWSRAFDSENNILVSSGLQTADGDFLIAASIDYFPANDKDILLVKVDGNGNELWSRTWEEGKQSVYDFIPTTDNNYLMAGAFAPPGETDYFMVDFLFVKIDPEGNDIWRNSFGDSTISDRAMVVSQTSDSGYIAAGGVAQIRLIKIDGNGQLLWEQSIENGTFETHNAFASILQHQDGGYIVTGSVIGNTSDIFLVKTDADGNVGQ